MLWTSKSGGKKAIFMPTDLRLSSDITQGLLFLKVLLAAGEIRPVIDRRYPLQQTTQALRYVDEGHKKGKVVITVKHDRPSSPG